MTKDLFCPFLPHGSGSRFREHLRAVPDPEIQELMTLYNVKWPSGMDKHEALRAAQLKMRGRVKARYGQDLLSYWGGFVLVGR
jgi:CHAT domain-containing protein